jgi:hypothetical protein
MMDSETLDRLLMDQALGALPLDVDMLLAAYLDHDAAAAARAREFAAATMAARRLLRQPTPTRLPPFPAADIHNVEQTQRRVHALGYVASMAAVLVVGIGLGLVFPRSPTRATPAPLITLASAAPIVAAHEAEAGFWSTQRLYENARQVRRADTPRLIWDSTTSLPRLGDRL